MITQLSIASLYFLGAAFAGVLAFRATVNRSAVALELVGLALCVAEWSFFYGLETLSPTADLRLLWSQFAYLGTYGSVAFLFRFCVRWLHPRWFGWWMLMIWVVPVVMVFGAFTNAFHGLVWTDLRPSEGFAFVYRYGHGSLFWLGIAYQYLLVTASLVLLGVAVARRRGIYRQQAALALAGLGTAVAGNAVYVARAISDFPLDITPLALAVGVGFMLAGVSRARLLELLPAARHRVVDVMPDGLIVLDHEMRIVDWNAAALGIWRLDGSQIMGAPIAEYVPGWSEVVPDPPPAAFTGSLRHDDDGSTSRHIDVELRRLATRSARHDGWIVLFHDSTQLRAAELRLQEANSRLETLNSELLRQAIHDGLTGLFNRSYLDEALPRELARAERDGRPIGLLILDIDHFKQVNDRHGHGAGDRVLARVARLVRTLVRAGDIPCRYGGDELVAVMPGATREEAMQAGERIRSSVADDRAVADVDPVTVSIGVAVYPEDATSATDLFRHADRALYEAKDLGRNRVAGATHVG